MWKKFSISAIAAIVVCLFGDNIMEKYGIGVPIFVLAFIVCYWITKWIDYCFDKRAARIELENEYQTLTQSAKDLLRELVNSKETLVVKESGVYIGANKTQYKNSDVKQLEQCKFVKYICFSYQDRVYMVTPKAIKQEK